MDYEVETPTDLRLSNTKTAEDSCNGRSAVLNSELGWSTSPGAAGVHGALLTSSEFSPNSAVPAQNFSVSESSCACFCLQLKGMGMVLPWGAEATQRSEHSEDWRLGWN